MVCNHFDGHVTVACGTLLKCPTKSRKVAEHQLRVCQSVAFCDLCSAPSFHVTLFCCSASVGDWFRSRALAKTPELVDVVWWSCWAAGSMFIGDCAPCLFCRFGIWTRLHVHESQWVDRHVSKETIVTATSETWRRQAGQKGFTTFSTKSINYPCGRVRSLVHDVHRGN